MSRSFEIRKWFFAWQDEKQESWLGDMSRKGLHLKGLASFGRFLFEQGSARDYAYRLDYNQDKPSEDYQQLILDSGWEHVGERNGWHYWRKEVKSGQASEIFTDTESKEETMSPELLKHLDSMIEESEAPVKSREKVTKLAEKEPEVIHRD